MGSRGWRRASMIGHRERPVAHRRMSAAERDAPAPMKFQYSTAVMSTPHAANGREADQMRAVRTRKVSLRQEALHALHGCSVQEFARLGEQSHVVPACPDANDGVIGNKDSTAPGLYLNTRASAGVFGLTTW